MPTFDFSARSGQTVLIPINTNVQDHLVYFRYSSSSTLSNYLEIQLSPVVMDGRNIVVKLPSFTNSLYYRVISKKLGQYYYHQNGQISYVSSGDGTGDPAGDTVVKSQMPIFTIDPSRPGVLTIEYTNL